MATKKPPAGTVRTNVHVNKENYVLFKKLSKAVNYTFTDLVNEALVQFNKNISAAIESNDINSLIELYNKQLDEVRKELDTITINKK